MCPELEAVLRLGDSARNFRYTSDTNDNTDISSKTKEEMEGIKELVNNQIDEWIKSASLFQNTKMNAACKFFEKHREEIVYASSLPFHISNSAVEGVNSQAKLLQRVKKGRYDEVTYILMLHHSFSGRETKAA